MLGYFNRALHEFLGPSAIETIDPDGLAVLLRYFQARAVGFAAQVTALWACCFVFAHGRRFDALEQECHFQFFTGRHRRPRPLPRIGKSIPARTRQRR